MLCASDQQPSASTKNAINAVQQTTPTPPHAPNAEQNCPPVPPCPVHLERRVSPEPRAHRKHRVLQGFLRCPEPHRHPQLQEPLNRKSGLRTTCIQGFAGPMALTPFADASNGLEHASVNPFALTLFSQSHFPQSHDDREATTEKRGDRALSTSV